MTRLILLHVYKYGMFVQKNILGTPQVVVLVQLWLFIRIKISLSDASNLWRNLKKSCLQSTFKIIDSVMKNIASALICSVSQQFTYFRHIMFVNVHHNDNEAQ